MAGNVARVVDQHLYAVTPRGVVIGNRHGPVVQLQSAGVVWIKRRKWTTHFAARSTRRRVESSSVTLLNTDGTNQPINQSINLGLIDG